MTPSTLGKRVRRSRESTSEDGRSVTFISLTVYMSIPSILRSLDVVSEGFNNIAQWYTGRRQVRQDSTTIRGKETVKSILRGS